MRSLVSIIAANMTRHKDGLPPCFTTSLSSKTLTLARSQVKEEEEEEEEDGGEHGEEGSQSRAEVTTPVEISRRMTQRTRPCSNIARLIRELFRQTLGSNAVGLFPSRRGNLVWDSCKRPTTM
ncbi:hypothetical protein M0802_000052 [Mischocyttarus mexicanus]|nr:hypothetical protein M0802_000052 [Mischocyttarus mexicanus]